MSRKNNLKVVRTVFDTYQYKDANGIVLFEKVRYHPKDFRLRKLINGEYIYTDVVKDLDPPLYNLDLILPAKLVCFCEGEKDANNLRAHGYISTSTFNGVNGKWLPQYTEALQGKHVVIFEDNDDPGRMYAEKVARQLDGQCPSIKVVSFPELPAKGDVTDYIQAHGIDLLKKKVKETPQWERRDEIGIEDPSAKSVKPKSDGDSEEEKGEWVVEQATARYEDFKELFKNFLGNHGVCIFSERLMHESRGKWRGVRNAIGRLRSEAMKRQQAGGLKYPRVLFDDHLDAYEYEFEPRFLVDIPEWDNVDRLKLFSDSCTLHEGPVTSEDFEYLLKDWMSKAFQKLYNPYIQNRILLLRGDQGVGKDTWTDYLLGGAGQFFTQMSLVTGDKDTFAHLNKGLFIRIAEFEKAVRADAETIKDLITTPKTFLRMSYDREPEEREVRCSFVANANTGDILRDTTGSRRFLIFHIEKIDWNMYPKTVKDQLQVLAQAKHLASEKYKADPGAEMHMKQYLKAHTPDDITQDIAALFEERLNDYIREKFPIEEEMLAKKSNFVANSKVAPVITTVSKDLGVSPRTVRIKLKVAGYTVRTKDIRGFKLRLIEPEQSAFTDDMDPFDELD